MKIIPYQDVNTVSFDSDVVKGVQGRVVIGKEDGANNFCMRVFEVEAKGFTPRHRHAWEHEIFFHAGKGEVLKDGEWHPVEPGHIVFIPGDEEHQIRNTAKSTLVFACLIPAGAPEL
jgi:quercetin dioxygenase-like cupin family protein